MLKLLSNNYLNDNSNHFPHLNILLPRHKDEDVSHHPTEVNLQGLLYCCLHIVLLRGLHSKQHNNHNISPGDNV